MQLTHTCFQISREAGRKEFLTPPLRLEGHAINWSAPPFSSGILITASLLAITLHPPSPSPPDPLAIPITMSVPYSTAHQHYDFFAKHPSEWTIESFVQHRMRESPLRPNPDRFLSRSWLVQLNNISKCRRGCTSACRDRAEDLLEEHRNVLSIIPVFLSIISRWQSLGDPGDGTAAQASIRASGITTHLGNVS